MANYINGISFPHDHDVKVRSVGWSIKMSTWIGFFLNVSIIAREFI